MTRSLPEVAGCRPRVALLVYRDAHSDSRVLKTAASLRAAGAEVQIVGSARDRSGFPAGLTATADGIPIYRAPDLDLARIFARTARAWRGLRALSRGRGPHGRQRTVAKTLEAPGDGAAGRGIEAPATVDGTAHPTLSALAADVWMRTYQVARLSYYWAGVLRQVRPSAPEVVHANDGNTLVPAMMLRAMCGSRIIYDSHELWTRRNVRQDRWFAPAVEAVIERIGVRYASGVVTVSPSIVAWLQDTYRLSIAPTLVRNIPHRDGDVPQPGQGRLRDLTGLGSEAKVIAYCGGITTGRGLEETVHALALLPDDVHLVMLGFGDAQYIAALLRRASVEGVSHRVHIAGAVPGREVPAALADADVAVVYVRPICLSYVFSLPNKLFESIHAGLPVVAADLPDTADVVRRFGVGEIFDARTPAELAAAIASVLASPDPYRQASRQAAPLLDWAVEAERLIELYARVLDGGARAG